MKGRETMNTLIKTSLLAITISTVLTACGGSSSDDAPVVTPPTTTPPVTTVPAEKLYIKGMAIDGYIVGATTFMDFNFNGVQDDNEPGDTTVEPGTVQVASFAIPVTQAQLDCGQYVPIITHVPVGAVDMDDPDNPVTEAYNMVIPPSFALQTDGDLLNVTPLTTVIWTEIENELRAESASELSCESIIAEQVLREAIEMRLRNQERRVATRYNTSIEELYSDYVASENHTLHDLAKALVPGLAASYSESVTLEAANPSADYSFVEYYFDTTSDAFNNQWTRLQYIMQSPGNWTEVGHTMRDIGVVSSTKFRNEQSTYTQDGIQVEVSFAWDGDVCTVSESYLEQSGTTGYGLINIAGAANVDWSMCQTMDRVALNTSQQFVTKTFYSDGTTVKTESAHQYVDDNPAKYTDMIGARAGDLSNGWLSNAMSHISLDFNDDYGYDSDSWIRINNVYSTEVFWEADQTVYMHNSSDVYEVTLYRLDGTTSKQCGTWSTGSLSGC